MKFNSKSSWSQIKIFFLKKFIPIKQMPPSRVKYGQKIISKQQTSYFPKAFQICKTLPPTNPRCKILPPTKPHLRSLHQVPQN